tara:strand:- start:6 stop:761 length:756 start_codon:yes stop_codon:yes gene_type:complete
LKRFSQNNYQAEFEISKIPRVGLIALSTDFTIEQDFRNVFYQQPVNLYVNRIPFDNPMNEKNYLKMRDALPSVAKNILPGESIDTIAYGCTSGTIAIGEKEIEKYICGIKNDCYVTTPITAALKVFNKLSLNKIAVLTPYPELVNKTIFNFLIKNNIDVTSFSSFNINSDKDVAMLKKETIIDTIKSIQDIEAEAIFVSCTAMPILSLINDIEKIINKPILSSNQAIIWDCLRSVKINKPIYGYGKLLELY